MTTKEDYHRDLVHWVREPRYVRAVQQYVSRIVGDHPYYYVTAERPPRQILFAGLTTLMDDVFIVRPVVVPGEAQRPRGRRPRSSKTAVSSPAASTKPRLPQRRTRLWPMIPNGAQTPPEYLVRGAGRGSIVHKHLEHMVALDRAAFLALHGHEPHPYAIRLMREFQRQDCYPCKAEFRVCDPVGRVAHRHDLLATNAAGRIIWTELKTGYTGTFRRRVSSGERWAPWLCEALPGWPREVTPLHKAIMQCALSAALGIRELGLPLDMIELWVMRIDDHTIEIETVPHDWFVTALPVLLRSITQAGRAYALAKGRA